MVKTGEWISEAWALVKEDLWMHVLLMIVLSLGSSITGGILQGPLMAGYLWIVFRKLSGAGYAPAVGDIGKGFEVFLHAFLAGIVGGLIASLGIIACIVGVFATAALMMFALPLVMDRRMDFWPAIQMSMEKVKENVMGWSLFVLALWALQLLGALICGVGTLVTGPIAIVALALAYRDNFGIQMVEAGGAAAPMAPPPAAPPAAPPPAPSPPPPPTG